MKAAVYLIHIGRRTWPFAACSAAPVCADGLFLRQADHFVVGKEIENRPIDADSR
jgi:hypothetical protein